jgi:hypothetical protein
MQFIAIHKLIQRNETSLTNEKIELPCLVVTGRSESKVEISDDSMLIISESPFHILSDTHLLAKMGLHKFSEAEINEHFPSEIFELLGKTFVPSIIENCTEEKGLYNN